MLWRVNCWMLLGLLALMPSGYAVEAHQVLLVGLFKDTAVIDVQGKQQVLKVGQTSPDGIKLIATSRSQATLSIDGKEHQLSLSRALSGGYQRKPSLSHSITINGTGQYFTAGSINGHTVTFLVDTGATAVALNTEQARRLGIDFVNGELGQVSTAGGFVKAYSVTLDRVKIGSIEVKNVRASVLEGVYPVYALLGMTYLRHVEIAEDNGMMTLTQKY